MQYVIIGGVAAGMSAAMEIYRTDDSAKITVLERGEDYSYGQCGLPYVVNGVIPSIDKVVARTVEQFRDKYGIDARIKTTVTGLDIEKQEVEALDLETEKPLRVPYDRLLIATGSDPIVPNWEGIGLPGIHAFKTMTDTKKLMEDLTDDKKDVTIVGGGYIGLEMAESFNTRGLKVRLIQREPQVAEIFDPEMAKFIQNEAERQGIEIILNESVQSFSGTDKVEEVRTDKASYQTDLVLLAIGVSPNTDFLKKTGIHMLRNGALIVNSYQETSISNIYAAGDCASHYNRVKKMNDHVPLGTTSNKQGRIAGANMAGHTMTFNGIVGTSIIKFCDLTLGRTGLSEKEAKALNLPYEVMASEARTHAGYYPGSEELHLKLLYHKETHKLLGGQIIGKKGVDKRIDVLATALYAGLTTPQLLDLDLGYAPPYNGVWDPIQQMVRKSGLV
ncbi:CoA-disulfide reductase [Amphibacillus sp. MSJ-3]|uniref:CoA-disulfide reductase n=1 Tax=Amphibacillus sp. MSJ-3 TaxID=2841505 RepID=UPI001C0F08DF|nr:CoA-disulfide reductase [Amphibacillus sp. MSJ-3]